MVNKLICLLSTSTLPVKLGIAALALAVILPLSYSAGGTLLGSLDDRAAFITTNTVNQVAAAFVTAKAINMGLSVASSTTISMGIGVNGSMTLGALLNPLDLIADTVTTWLLFAATIACSAELLADFCKHLGGGTAALVLLGLGATIIMRRVRAKERIGAKGVDTVQWGALALVLVLRIGLPLALVGSEAGYNIFLAARYNQAFSALSETQSQTEVIYKAALADKDHPEQSWLPNWFKAASDNMGALAATSAVLYGNFDHFFESTFTMMAILIFKLLLLPLSLLWIIARLARRLSRLP